MGENYTILMLTFILLTVIAWILFLAFWAALDVLFEKTFLQFLRISPETWIKKWWSWLISALIAF